MSGTGIGAAVRRKEDRRFITGKGHYTDDINRPGQTFAYFLRSPHAHATIKSIDAKAASAMPGVLAVLTGVELANDKIGNLICGWMIHSKDGTPMKMAAHPALASGKACHVGDPVAVVDRRDVGAGARCGRKSQSRLWRAAGRCRSRSGAEARRAANPRHCAAVTRSISGISAMPKRPMPLSSRPSMSPSSTSSTIAWCRTRSSRARRSAITIPAPASFTLWNTTQNPHVARLVIAAFVGMAPEHKLRVIAPDVGGGFGSKIFIYPEEVVALWAAKRVGRPVKWVSDRSEAFLADAHGRDHVTHAEMAFDADGKITALRAKTIANLGAYMSTFSSSVPTYLYATLLSGQYEIPQIYCEVDAVYTNTVPVDAYRGAGRPEATFVVERLVEVGARELGVDPAELRRQEFRQDVPAPDAGDHELRRRRL